MSPYVDGVVTLFGFDNTYPAPSSRLHPMAFPIDGLEAIDTTLGAQQPVLG